jgi:hypothetical protein
MSIPKWVVKAIVTTSIGVIVSGASAWGVHLSTKSNDHEKRIAVMEDHQKGIDKSLDEIKSDTKEILKQLHRR